MPLFLGVDGGQSGTTALIADERGKILGRGSAGPCNHVSGAEATAKFLRVMRQCIQAATAEAALSRSVDFEAACFGMSGGPKDKEALMREEMRSRLWLFTNDAVIALTGAFAGEPGVITIAGTGSIALGRNQGEAVRRAGGWGYIFGDEGGAFDIVREALRAGLRAEEGWGPPTVLSDVLRGATGCARMDDVLHLFYTQEWPRSRVATLAPSVDLAAREGDAAAEQILAGAAQKLSTLTLSVRRQLWAESSDVRCSYVGGVFRSPSILLRYRALLELSGCAVQEPLLGPAMGAVIEACKLAGFQPLPDELLSSKFRHE